MLSGLSTRVRIGTAASIVVLTIAGVVWLVIAAQTPEVAAVADTTAPITAADPTTSATAEPSVTVTDAGIGPGDLIATIAGDTVDVYDAAGDSSPREILGRFSYYGNVRTFMGLETRDVEGDEWIHVQLPEYPTNTTGWVKASEVTVDSTDVVINVYLDEREVELVADGDVELTSTAVIGAEASPTPLGTFFIADPVDFTADPTGTYGAYALGLSAYSETLKTFKGALPQIALHGTNSDKYFGEDVSNGCVRLPDAFIRELAARTSLGTPVVIHQSRGAADT